MDQSNQVNELFFIRLEAKNKFSCVLVTFKRDHLSISSNPKENHRVQYKDIISCLASQGPSETWCLQFNYTDTLNKGLIFKTKTTRLQSLNLFTGQIAKRNFWKTIGNQITQDSQLSDDQMEQIIKLLEPNQIPANPYDIILEQEPRSHYNEESKESLNQIKMIDGKFIVFVNPASGKGLASQKWQQALVILGKTGHTFRVINTESVGYCKRFLHDMDLDDLLQYKGIILVSGDGLPHEAINGIFTRKDWKQAIQVPFGVLPGGSGNALSKNITYQSGLDASNESAALLIAKGNVKHIDLMMFETKLSRIFSFLSLAWAFISDVDLGSEGMRFLGETRFTVFGTWRSIFQKKYSGKLYFSKDKIEVNVIDDLIDGKHLTTFPKISQSIEEFTHLMEESKQDQLTWTGGALIDFTYFLVTKQPYISENFYSSPLCKLDDGLMDIQVLNSGDGWGQLVSLALNQEQGKHIDMKTQRVVKGSKCKYEKVSAFRLEPSNQESFFSIDGEKYDAQSIQGVVMSNLLKVFCS